MRLKHFFFSLLALAAAPAFSQAVNTEVGSYPNCESGDVIYTDQSGGVTIGSASTATCTITFGTAYSTDPRSVHLQAANAAAATGTER